MCLTKMIWSWLKEFWNVSPAQLEWSAELFSFHVLLITYLTTDFFFTWSNCHVKLSSFSVSPQQHLCIYLAYSDFTSSAIIRPRFILAHKIFLFHIRNAAVSGHVAMKADVHFMGFSLASPWPVTKCLFCFVLPAHWIVYWTIKLSRALTF